MAGSLPYTRIIKQHSLLQSPFEKKNVCNNKGDESKRMSRYSPHWELFQGHLQKLKWNPRDDGLGIKRHEGELRNKQDRF